MFNAGESAIMGKIKKLKSITILELIFRLTLAAVLLVLLRPVLSNTIIIVLLGLVVLDVGITAHLMNNTMKPLIEIEKIVHAIDNDNEVSETGFKKKYVQWKDDEVLSELFSFIEQILQANYNAQILKSQAEINALQSQINPHFLYNTLETIRSQAVIKGVDSVEEMTEAGTENMLPNFRYDSVGSFSYAADDGYIVSLY